MELNIGDKIKYKNENINGHYLLGEVVDIWKNSSQVITGYFVTLDSGEFVHIQSDSNRWLKIN